MADEACDDGDKNDGRGCTADCQGVLSTFTCSGGTESSNDNCDPICGDGVVLSPEACDDDNTDDLDGCDSSCAEETGWTCDSSQPSICSGVCGDDR